jgi:anti-sigma B factor antagonist
VPEGSAEDRGVASDLYAVPPAFVCSWRAHGLGTGWVHAAGEVDLATSSRLRERLEEARRSFGLVVLDLRELSFIDSSGIHVILDVAACARRKEGRLVIVRGAAQVDLMLTLTGVSTQVLVFDLNPSGLPHALSHRLPPVGAA